jgi:hypothetical protein
VSGIIGWVPAPAVPPRPVPCPGRPACGCPSPAPWCSRPGALVKPATPVTEPATRNPTPASPKPPPDPPASPLGPPSVYLTMCAGFFLHFRGGSAIFRTGSLRLGFYGCLIRPCYQPTITDTTYVISVTLVTGQ